MFDDHSLQVFEQEVSKTIKKLIAKRNNSVSDIYKPLLNEFERPLLLGVLGAVDGDIEYAATVLGLSRQYIPLANQFAVMTPLLIL